MTQAEKLVQAAPPPAQLLATNATSAITRSKGFGRYPKANPVTGKLTDPIAEAAAHTVAAMNSVAKGNRARDYQLKHEQMFDFITGRPRVPEPPLPAQKPTTETFSSRVPFNVITAEPLPDVLLTTRARSAPAAARAQGSPTKPLVNYAPSLVRRRAINIVTNEYNADPGGVKATAEAEALRKRAVRRYWQTRNFNPLLQRYEDPTKEAAAHDELHASQAVQGVAQAARLPVCLRLTLGRAYDIVAHEPRDPAVLETLDTMENRRLRRLTRPATEARLAEEGEAAATLAETRRLNAQGQLRQVQLSDPHGFDVTTSQPRDPGLLRHTLAGRGLSAWDRISRDLGADGSAAAGVGAAASVRLPPLSGRSQAGLGAGFDGYTGGGGGGGSSAPPTPSRAHFAGSKNVSAGVTDALSGSTRGVVAVPALQLGGLG